MREGGRNDTPRAGADEDTGEDTGEDTSDGNPIKQYQ